MSNNSDLIISIEEARKILGKEYEKYSDLKIEKIIRELDSIAVAFIKSVQK